MSSLLALIKDYLRAQNQAKLATDMLGYVDHFSSGIVPANQFEESAVELDVHPCVKNAGVCIVQEIRRYDFVIGVTQNALEISFTGLLHFSADLSLARLLRGTQGKVDH